MKIKLFIGVILLAGLASSCRTYRTCPTYAKSTDNVKEVLAKRN